METKPANTLPSIRFKSFESSLNLGPKLNMLFEQIGHSSQGTYPVLYSKSLDSIQTELPNNEDATVILDTPPKFRDLLQLFPNPRELRISIVPSYQFRLRNLSKAKFISNNRVDGFYIYGPSCEVSPVSKKLPLSELFPSNIPNELRRHFKDLPPPIPKDKKIDWESESDNKYMPLSQWLQFLLGFPEKCIAYWVTLLTLNEKFDLATSLEKKSGHPFECFFSRVLSSRIHLQNGKPESSLKTISPLLEEERFKEEILDKNFPANLEPFRAMALKLISHLGQNAVIYPYLEKELHSLGQSYKKSLSFEFTEALFHSNNIASDLSIMSEKLRSLIGTPSEISETQASRLLKFALSQKSYQQALEILNSKSNKLSPRFQLKWRSDLANRLSLAGERTIAASLFEDFKLEAFSDFDVDMSKAIGALQNLRLFEQASKQLERLRKSYVKGRSLNARWGVVKHCLGDNALALKLVQNDISIEGKTPFNQLWLGRLNRLAGNTPSAIEHLEEHLATDCVPTHIPIILYELGICYSEIGKQEESIERFKSATDYPTIKPIWKGIALFELALEEAKNDRFDIEKIRSDNKILKHTNPLQIISILSKPENETEDIRQQLEEFHAKWPYPQFPYHLLSKALIHLLENDSSVELKLNQRERNQVKQLMTLFNDCKKIK